MVSTNKKRVKELEERLDCIYDKINRGEKYPSQCYQEIIKLNLEHFKNTGEFYVNKGAGKIGSHRDNYRGRRRE